MATIAKLVVELGLEDNAFQRGIKNSRAKLNDWGESLRSVGTKLTAGVTTPLLAAGLGAVNWASDLEQAIGKSEAVFGSSSDSVLEWSEGTAKAFGFAKSDAIAMAATYGSLFKVMGMSNEVASDYSMELIGLAADMSAFNDVSNERASEALMAGLSGEYMSLRSMGVFLNEAAVSTEALRIATADGRDEITEADKVQARYNLIMEQTAQQQGQAARESKGFASRLAQVRAQVKNLGASIGQKLMPHALKLLDSMESLVNWFGKLSPTTQKWAIIIAGLAAAMGPLLLIIGMMLPGLSALLGVIAFLVSPIGLVVLAIAALAAGLIYAYTHFETFRTIVDTVAAAIMSFISGALDGLIAAFTLLKEAFDADGWSGVWDVILTGLQLMSDGAMALLQSLADRVLAWLRGVAVSLLAGAAGLVAAGIAWIQGLWDGAVSKWNEFTAWLGGLKDRAVAWIVDTATALWQKGSDFIQGLWDGAKAKWAEFVEWVASLPSRALGAAGEWLTTLWQKGTDLITGIYLGAIAKWNDIITWLTALPGYALAAVPDLLATLMQKGRDIITGFHLGVVAKWNDVTSWLGTVASLAVTAIGTLTSTLTQKGRDLLTGLWNGALAIWVSLSAWITSIPGLIVTTIGSLSSTLYQKGVDVIVGLWNGVLAMWASLSGWFSGLGGLIAGAIGDLSGSLYNAGLSIMNGLLSGLKAGWDTVTGWLGTLNPANYKGPEARDKKMLVKPGLWIMEGLSDGLDTGWDRVTRQLSSYSPELSGSLGADGFGASGGRSQSSTPLAQQPPQVIHVYALKPDELQHLMEQAERGGNFATARSKPSSMTQYVRGARR